MGISTVEGENNYYSELLELKNDKGLPLFKTIEMVLKCARCRRTGSLMECEHRKHLIPNFRGIQRMQKVKAVMAVDPELYEREALGVTITNTVYLFNPYAIEALFKRNLYTFRRPPDVAFVSIDPSGGGDQSLFSICSGVNDMGHAVVSV